MNKQKKVFLFIAAIFLLIILFIAYDMSTRTTFPGSKKNDPADTVKVQEK